VIDVSSQQLWDDFVYYQSCTGHQQQRRRTNPFIKPLKATVERLRLMDKMKQWCAEKNVPVRQWLYSLFATRRWLFAPQLTPGHLCSENHLIKFATFSDYDFYTDYVQRLAQSQPLEGNFDPNRDLSHTAEENKRYYVASGRMELCMSQMATETFGFHPKSKICVECSLRVKCAERLQASVRFDIQAVRRGELSAEAAYRQTLTQVFGYGN
jgi:hypothetical protein